VTPDGKVKEKFVETAYTDRYTASNLILKLFPNAVEGNGREVAARQLNPVPVRRGRSSGKPLHGGGQWVEADPTE
jgi:hypothetical protein